MVDVACPSCTDMDPDCTECFGTGVVRAQEERVDKRDAGRYYALSLAGEKWAPIPEGDGYSVSSHGRVVNTETGHILKAPMNVTGVRTFAVYRGQKKVFLMLSRTVARAFLPDYRDGYRIVHKDGNKENCHVNNLEQLDIRVRGKRNV